jgi:IS30 family transposase
MSTSKSSARGWTLDEEKKLCDLLNAGAGAADIAVALGRTRQAVYAQLQRLYRKQTRLSALSRGGLKREENLNTLPKLAGTWPEDLCLGLSLKAQNMSKVEAIGPRGKKT